MTRPVYHNGEDMRPRLFDIRANDLSNEGVPVLQPWKRIVLDPDDAGAWIVAGDVDAFHHNLCPAQHYPMCIP